MTAPPSEISSVPAPAPLAGPHGVRPGARRRETPEAVRPGDHDRPESAAPDVCVLEIIIPAFNEATRLVASLRETVSFLEAQPWRSRLVVVDNGSADETAAVARAVTSEQVELAVIGCARQARRSAEACSRAARRSSVSSTPTSRRRYPRSFEPWRSYGLARWRSLRRGTRPVADSRSHNRSDAASADQHFVRWRGRWFRQSTTPNAGSSSSNARPSRPQRGAASWTDLLSMSSCSVTSRLPAGGLWSFRWSGTTIADPPSIRCETAWRRSPRCSSCTGWR